jgi:hypothetical protein
VERPAMARQPDQHLGMFMGGIVVRARCGSPCRRAPRARPH